MALIHEKLYQSTDLANVNFGDYAKRLVATLLRSYETGARNIRVDYEVEEVFLGIDQAVPCGLILNELITNTLRHAFTADDEGEIKISLNIDKRGMVNLIIKDNGSGIPENFNLEESESMGMRLVATLVDQLDGDIDIMVEEGTEFRISFKAR